MLAHDLFKLGRRIVKNGRIIEKTGKPDIPRFLYHITSKKNYDSMLKSGIIKTSEDSNRASELKGVFLFDMKNFVKRWANTSIHYSKDVSINLGGALLYKNGLPGDNLRKVTDIVLLRIPTKNMDINKLKIRPQNLMKEVIKGDSALYQTIYTRRKNPIEYIYGENIDVSTVQKIGETQLEFNSIIEAAQKLAEKPFELLMRLLKGQPEEKGVKILSQQNFKEGIIKF